MISKIARKILIVDSGMRGLGGHNFTYTQAVQAALERRGSSVTVLVHKSFCGSLAEATGYLAVFSCGAYDFAPGHGFWRDLKYIRAQSIIYAEELEQACRRVAIEEYGLVFCHTVGDFELMGWSRYLRRTRFPGKLMILLRQTPGYARCGLVKRLLHPYWRIRPHYLKVLNGRLKDRFTLLTDSEPLSEDYACIHRGRILTMPIPVNEHILDRTNGEARTAMAGKQFGLKRGSGLRVGYMGDTRSVKGFELLPRLVNRVLTHSDEQVRFVVQCPAPASSIDGAPAPAVAELHQLTGKFGERLCLVGERLSDSDYADLFHSLDIVLLPYDKGAYTEATSGIFAEAVALGKPVVVPSETWMSRELGRAGAGVEFESGKADDLAAKVLHLVRNYPEYASRAKERREHWRRFHNADMLADILLKESKLVPTDPVESGTSPIGLVPNRTSSTATDIA